MRRRLFERYRQFQALPPEVVAQGLRERRAEERRREMVFVPELDLGIQNAVRKAYRMRKRPTPKQLRKIGAKWSPHSSVASWYLWRSLENGDGQLGAFLHGGFFQPMDTLREKMYLEQLWSEGKAPWKVW